MGRWSSALALAMLMLFSSLSGCFGRDEPPLSGDDLEVGLDVFTGGIFQGVKLTAGRDLAVFVPYLVRDGETGFIQNSTVVDLAAGADVQLDILAPPRSDNLTMLVGMIGREYWPVRESNESWDSWLSRGGANGGGAAVHRIQSLDENGSLEQLNSSERGRDGGMVAVLTKAVVRQSAAAHDDAAGGRHSTGIINGRTVYDRLHEITDPSSDLSDIDGRRGYFDRWAGQGNPAYEDAAQYLIQQLDSFGLEVKTHRFEFTDIFDKQNPEAYNICGYRWGSVYPDEWLVFGAHFDMAPPANGVIPLLDPHVSGVRTYGTREGAYDNTAGTSMVLETARAMSAFDSRRTMVFCLWSGEEGGKRGSDYWTEYFVKEDNPEVTVTNYINLDMAGVNWPGGGGAPHGDPQPTIDDEGYPKDEEIWPMRVYIGPSSSHEGLDQPGMVHLSEWIGADALGLEKQMGTLVGTGLNEDTWKYDAWINDERPEITIYEDTTARSDHASFQDNLGTVTLGFGGLVDGYWCYHQTCDTLEEMEGWMDTSGKDYGEEHSGASNLVDSLDFITWWAAYSFFHLDEKPITNEIVTE
jgi:hypothetical protein